MNTIPLAGHLLMAVSAAAGSAYASAGAAAFAHMYVAPTIEGLTPAQAASFFERIQTDPGEVVLAQRGHWVALQPGMHTFKVPCDKVAPGQFATISYTPAAGLYTAIVFRDCGMVYASGHSEQEAAREKDGHP